MKFVIIISAALIVHLNMISVIAASVPCILKIRWGLRLRLRLTNNSAVYKVFTLITRT